MDGQRRPAVSSRTTELVPAFVITDEQKVLIVTAVTQAYNEGLGLY